MTLIQIPNGLLDGTDLFNYAEVDELRGKDQNYLANKELVVGNIGHLPKILESRLLSLQTKEGRKWQGNISDAIYKLPSGDLETILINIRLNTYGPRLYFQAQCPHCEQLNKNLRVDLDKLELQVMPIEEMIKPKKLVLPKSQVEVELKPIYLNDLFEIIKIANNKQDSLITSLVTVSLKRIGDKVKISASDVEDLPATDIIYLQEEIQNIKLEGHIDSMVEGVTCQNCKKEFDQKLQVFDPSFFYPTKG